MKTAAELNITEEQRINLARLAVGVRKLRRGRRGYNGLFKMNTFGRNETRGDIYPEESTNNLHKCGTAACLAGHGPFLGIAPNHDEGWWKYITRCFGFQSQEAEWVWLFEPEWDNNKARAVKRIAWFLEYGIPSVFSATDNKYPKGFFQYKPDWAAIEALAKGGSL